MQIITLTTDMGLKDHYVASLKGRLLQMIPNVHIVDITHLIKPFNSAEAAYTLRSCIADFPKGTIHIVGVDTEPILNFGNAEGAFPSLMQFKGQYFIGNDNGFFGAFLGDDRPDKFYRIEDVLSNPKDMKSPTKNIYLGIAQKIVEGQDFNLFATEQSTYKKFFLPAALFDENLIKGTIIHIDAYGNLITNVTKDMFDGVGKGANFEIHYRNKEYNISKISMLYNEVAAGDRVALFNSNNHLEIAINRGANEGLGGANKMFGVKVGDSLQIRFFPRGSHDTLESLF